MIILKDVNLAYSKDYNALMNINLEIKTGETVAIVGGPGCGKTALLRVIAGLETIKSGATFLKDTPIKKINFSRDVSLGYITHKAIFFEKKSVQKNLEWILKVHKIDKSQRKQLIDKALNDYEISHLAEEKIGTLCESDRRLVQIARLSLRPLEILLCDNILTNKDTVTEEKVKNALKKLLSTLSKDRIFIIATENEDIAKEFDAKIIKLELGSIIGNDNEEE